ncbi:hypothetical protein BDW02DRAFT_31179 [Decorospora gaudefroyi]|uniref:Uncharacterized protein n=1 Tax=Decorospora gaudefroyi TaxID=184978 RepID=A0A6A5KIH3_9PLEO|nr:hypothetical protein BDW02DRAFT_31179 [Decorospora gaudefroyi]
MVASCKASGNDEREGGIHVSSTEQWGTPNGTTTSHLSIYKAAISLSTTKTRRSITPPYQTTINKVVIAFPRAGLLPRTTHTQAYVTDKRSYLHHAASLSLPSHYPHFTTRSSPPLRAYNDAPSTRQLSPRPPPRLSPLRTCLPPIHRHCVLHLVNAEHARLDWRCLYEYVEYVQWLIIHGWL